MSSQTNQSDRKTLNNLVDKLLKLPKKSSPKSTSPRQLSDTRPRRKLLQKNSAGARVTPKKNLTPTPKKFKSLNVSMKKQEKGSKKQTLLTSGGLIMPSYEKILADIKKYDEYKEKVKKLVKFDENILNTPLPNDCLIKNESSNVKALDCKHLSNDDLKAAFNSHKRLLRGIFTSAKHKKSYKLFENRSNQHMMNLVHNAGASFLTLKQEQIDYLLNLITTEFDPERNKFLYFFQVLLPHLCLLIFMDEHEMTEEEANLYFNKMPIDGLSSLSD